MSAAIRAGVGAGALLVLGSLGAAAEPAALTPIALELAKTPISLNGQAQYLIENKLPQAPERQPDQVAAERVNGVTQWAALPDSGIYPLGPKQSLWVAFSTGPNAASDRWLVDVPYSALDSAKLYTQEPSGAWSVQAAGDLLPNSRWAIPNRYPIFTLPTTTQPVLQHLLRIENAQGFSAPLRLVDSRYAFHSEQEISLYLGMYTGTALLALLVGTLGALLLRDKAYAFYALCAGLIGLTQAIIAGLAGLHFWPNSPDWADRSLSVVGSLALASFLVLNASVIYLNQRSKRLNQFMWACAALGAVVAGLLYVTDSSHRLSVVVPYMLLVMGVVIGINLWAWRHGDPFGGWVLMGCAPFVLGMGLAVARYLQWLPLSFLTEYALQVGMALQLAALLVMLFVRSQRSRETRRRILGLDRIDPTTGLINQFVFAERLLRMAARSERMRLQSAVMLIDVTNSAQILREFGAKSAQELPLRLAARLQSTAREIDSAASLSEGRFGMLIEGPFTPNEAAELGPRIVARCLMPYAGLHADCVPQVRVAYALVPYKGAGAQSLLSRLEDKLSTAARRDDKRAVFMLADFDGAELARSR